MKKLKVGFFRWENNSEALRDMFQDELENHPMIEYVDWQATNTRLGNVVKLPVATEIMINNLLNYDLIFLDADDISDRVMSILDINKIWKKVIIFDMCEDNNRFLSLLDKCLLYIKCSYSELINKYDNVIPLDWGILQSYIDVVPRNMYPERDTAIMCSLQQGSRGCKRDLIVDIVKTTDWRPVKTGELNTVTLVYTSGSTTSSACRGYRFDPSPKFPDMPHWWVIYMHLMNRSKIVVTGSSHSRVGDHRTWEAFSSGALVCVDEIPIPMPNPMIAGEHYIKFDLKNIQNTIQTIKELLKNDIERERIAKAGFEYAMQYHSSKARVGYVMNEILKRYGE